MAFFSSYVWLPTGIFWNEQKLSGWFHHALEQIMEDSSICFEVCIPSNGKRACDVICLHWYDLDQWVGVLVPIGYYCNP